MAAHDPVESSEAVGGAFGSRHCKGDLDRSPDFGS
jgi:hypothetical protein